MWIRRLTASDVAAAPTWLHGADLRPDRWRDETTRAVVGLEAARVVAVGRIFLSRVHAGRYWTEIIVRPDQRRRGHGRRVAAHLALLRPDPRPMCTRGYVSSEAVLFARSLGAHPYRTCPPQRVPTASASALPRDEVATVAAVDVDRDELRRAWTDIYAWVHAAWSPVAPGFERPLLSGFDADLDLIHTRVVVDSTIRAAAFVFQASPHPVVVAECRTGCEPAGPQRLRACVRDALLTLAADGTVEVTFDGHDSDPHFRPLLDELPATGEPFHLLEWHGANPGRGC